MKNSTQGRKEAKAPQAITYKVNGFAMVPWEVEIHIEAVSEAEAKEKAREVFKSKRSDCLVAGSFDTSSVHGFEPSVATIL